MVIQGSPFLPQFSLNGQSLLNTKSICLGICRCSEESVSLLTVKCTNFKMGSDPALAKKTAQRGDGAVLHSRGTGDEEQRESPPFENEAMLIITSDKKHAALKWGEAGLSPPQGCAAPVAQAVCLGGGHSAPAHPPAVSEPLHALHLPPSRVGSSLLVIH